MHTSVMKDPSFRVPWSAKKEITASGCTRSRSCDPPASLITVMQWITPNTCYWS